jgi:hypothetical protein
MTTIVTDSFGTRYYSHGIPPIELTVKGTDKVVAWACGKCRNVKHEDFVLACCAEGRICCKPGCDESTEYSHFTVCNKHRAESEWEREREVFNKATKVSWRDYPDGWLYSEHFGKYFASFEDLAMELSDTDPEDWPEYVYGCDKMELSLDARDIIENATQNFYEDAVEDLDEKSLQIVLDHWVEAQKLEAYEANYNVAVTLEGFEEMTGDLDVE